MLHTASSRPACTDDRVIVVGAGLAGLAAALELAEQGVPVLVLEKGDVGGEQSNFAMGWVRTTGRPLAEIPLSLLNRRRFDALTSNATRDTWGVLFSAGDAAHDARLEQWAQGAAQFGVKTRKLGAAQTAARLPGCSAPLAGGLMTNVDTSADPRQLMQLLAARAAACGVEIRTRCAVRALDMIAGAVRGVVTEHGIERAAAVVLATGAWTRLMLQGARYTLPSVKVRSALARVRVAAQASSGGAQFARCAAIADVGYRALPDGTFVVGLADRNRVEVTPDAVRFAPRYLPLWWSHRGEIAPTLGRRFIDECRHMRAPGAHRVSVYERERALRPQPDATLAARAAQRFAALFPGLGFVEVIDSWAGYLDMTSDGLPVISALARTPGLFVSAGLCGSGLGTALGAGRLIASLVTGSAPEIDVAPFRIERFTRQSRAAPSRAGVPHGCGGHIGNGPQ
ncbi:NAD(P)/FAD-dependent oxidoreductase [Burkholderia cenocepacia]|uniref:NAD(P)/FAD-dependent oxidoreductase n=1 Tax=Burkholderia cenocepacia TaxID=95486 RepID=UPI002876C597|nr:FAD-binding oxidoreductase [Burkholderia cenocepacia]MDS0806594.1 FAD-binding oxidoreductase [Burkholderia cenocepacia]